MTERQYKKYLTDINKPILDIVWCKKCKSKGRCDSDQKWQCILIMEKRHHTGEWAFESGLEKEQELDKRIKELKKALKKKGAK